MPADTTPLFDDLVTERGNPFGGHQDMPRPRINLTPSVAGWPSLTDANGDPPTMEIPVIPDSGHASALAQLDHPTIEPPRPTQE